MLKQQIEAWALRLIQQAKAGRQNEDAFSELKAEWPADTGKFARQLAGMANAARGNPILVLMGVKEAVGPVTCDRDDFQRWFGAVRSCFDENVYPIPLELETKIDGFDVLAICFETDRAPYVVKNRAGGAVSREVPWREGTDTQSARHSDLIKILVPRANVPRIEVTDAMVRAVPYTAERRDIKGPAIQWSLTSKLFIDAPTEVEQHIRLDRCAGTLRLSESDSPINLDVFAMSGLHAHKTNYLSGLIPLQGPAFFRCDPYGDTPLLEVQLSQPLEVVLTFALTSEATSSVSFALPPDNTEFEEVGCWSFGALRRPWSDDTTRAFDL